MPFFIAAAPQVISTAITVSDVITALSVAGAGFRALDLIVTSVNHLLND